MCFAGDYRQPSWTHKNQGAVLSSREGDVTCSEGDVPRCSRKPGLTCLGVPIPTAEAISETFISDEEGKGKQGQIKGPVPLIIVSV